MKKISSLLMELGNHTESFAPLMPYQPNHKDVAWIDLSKENQSLLEIDFNAEGAVAEFMTKARADLNAHYLWGGFNEHRVWYQRSELFGSDRCIHLGIDVWADANTPVFAPVAGVVHSFQDNAGYGNYGPTIVLEHQIGSEKFYTLYGHLSRASLASLSIGQAIAKGEKIAELGAEEENGNWTPHVHFQAMADMEGYIGDFPGVCSLADREKYLGVCFDPNIFLGFDK